MKKVWLLLLSVALILSTAACKSAPPPTIEDIQSILTGVDGLQDYSMEMTLDVDGASADIVKTFPTLTAWYDATFGTNVSSIVRLATPSSGVTTAGRVVKTDFAFQKSEAETVNTSIVMDSAGCVLSMSVIDGVQYINAETLTSLLTSLAPENAENIEELTKHLQGKYLVMRAGQNVIPQNDVEQFAGLLPSITDSIAQVIGNEENYSLSRAKHDTYVVTYTDEYTKSLSPDTSTSNESTVSMCAMLNQSKDIITLSHVVKTGNIEMTLTLKVLTESPSLHAPAQEDIIDLGQSVESDTGNQ